MLAIWDNRLCVGDAVIDGEHRLVLNLLNEIEVAFAVRAPDEVVAAALDAMVRAVERHFGRDEERIVTHQDFLGRLRAFRSTLPQPVDAAERRRLLLDLAARWIDHMGRREAKRGMAQITQRHAAERAWGR